MTSEFRETLEPISTAMSLWASKASRRIQVFSLKIMVPNFVYVHGEMHIHFITMK